MSGEFLTQLYNTFDYIPDRYRLDISISFRNPEGYSEERLEVIFRKNMILALRIISSDIPEEHDPGAADHQSGSTQEKPAGPDPARNRAFVYPACRIVLFRRYVACSGF